MAKRHQPMMSSSLIPGVFASGLLILIASLAFGSLLLFSPKLDVQQILEDSYLWHVIGFTFWQAFLSTILSIVPAILLARALFRRRFPGRALFLRLCAMTLVLPVLVAIFGILSIYGKTGWLAQLCEYLAIDFQFTPYGLKGILLAHVFFNMPLATRLLLQALESIAIEQRQTAAQLAMNEWQQFRILEWPYLRRQMLPTGVLIFMLCFASFATIMALGGGPAATTIELAIYQALSYDFDPSRAALLALIQIVFCLGLMLLSQKINSAFSVGFSQQNVWVDPHDNRWRKSCDFLLIVLAILLLVPPLIAILVDGLNSGILNVLRQTALWQALITSVFIAICAGFLCVTLTIMLLWSNRELRLNYSNNAAKKLSQMIELSGSLILAMPSIVIATGFFILFNETGGLPESPYFLIILTNALIAIPYAIKVLENPMRDLAERYNPLCQSLEIRGLTRLTLIELKALKRPIGQALAFACVISLGDFGVVALFGSADFRTLPYYLYQQIGSYRTQDGAVTAMLLFLLCFSLFSLIERLAEKYDD